MVRKPYPRSIQKLDEDGHEKEYLSRKEVIDRLKGTISSSEFDRNKFLFTPYKFVPHKYTWYSAEEIERVKKGEYPLSIYTRKAAIQLPAGLQDDWPTTLRSLGYEVQTVDCSLEEDVALPQEIVSGFGLDPSLRYVKRTRMTYANRQPICWWYTCYRSDLVQGEILSKMKRLESIDTRHAIEEQHHLSIIGGYEFKSARVPTPDEQRLLQMGRSEAVLILERTALTTSHDLVFVQYLVLHGLWFKPINWYDVKPKTFQ